MLLMIDNYDSFTYNLVHYFAGLDIAVKTFRHDEISVAAADALQPDYLVISPGPCTPHESGISLPMMAHFSGKIPILGICLGMQCMVQQYGGRVVRAPQVMHGKTSVVSHTAEGIFSGIPLQFKAARYHSLVADQPLPEPLVKTAWAYDEQTGVEIIMGVAHCDFPTYGVQFHPEAILTEHGYQLLQNFLNARACSQIACL